MQITDLSKCLSFLLALSFCSAAEFVVYKLQEMGKISQEDVTAILERFQNLDVDQSGTLTTSDIVQSRN